jgi:hypothetical protein
MTLDQVYLGLFSTEIIKDLTTYEEPIKNELEEDQITWENTINKEFKEKEKRGV